MATLSPVAVSETLTVEINTSLPLGLLLRAFVNDDVNHMLFCFPNEEHISRLISIVVLVAK